MRSQDETTRILKFAFFSWKHGWGKDQRYSDPYATAESSTTFFSSACVECTVAYRFFYLDNSLGHSETVLKILTSAISGIGSQSEWRIC